jgi:hypothetical protein
MFQRRSSDRIWVWLRWYEIYVTGNILGFITVENEAGYWH